MQLSKRIPGTTKTITFRWCKREYLQMSPNYRKIRSRCRNRMDACYWCGHKFKDGEMMALAALETPAANQVFCHVCIDAARGEGE